MNQLILATHNNHKAQEFRDILPQYFVQTIADLGHDKEIEETATDLEGNSFLKAETIFKRYGHVVISDDMTFVDTFTRIVFHSNPKSKPCFICNS